MRSSPLAQSFNGMQLYEKQLNSKRKWTPRTHVLKAWRKSWLGKKLLQKSEKETSLMEKKLLVGSEKERSILGLRRRKLEREERSVMGSSRLGVRGAKTGGSSHEDSPRSKKNIGIGMGLIHRLKSTLWVSKSASKSHTKNTILSKEDGTAVKAENEDVSETTRQNEEASHKRRLTV
ncbi:hypothetical protein GH714_033199 [Hevea brasiliensis]|uniref:Uncharacterized protein n=1 Tax=Hevea brasiliensis TaxID=3981 RepID=A0A6A6L2L5_HEVBR|nr:hypothetical protein GH714_033199 [Hevea brasiliensis]